jgi:uncharacterized membrane protein
MSTKKTKYLVVTTFFMAIVLVQMIVPWLGMLPLGAFVVGASATIIQFTVAIAAIILGPKYGAFIGAFWGVLSFIKRLNTSWDYRFIDVSKSINGDCTETLGRFVSWLSIQCTIPKSSSRHESLWIGITRRSRGYH